MTKYRIFPLLILIFQFTAAYAQDPVHEFTLDNGLKILVKEDHRAPIVISEVWYRVGSSYEHSGITGLSHVLEHMMFKGTEKYPPGEFSRIIAANGGRENAFTSRDYTGYFQILEKSRLPIAMEMEADRMRNLQLSKEEFAKEVRVVMEERRMRVEDDPQSKTYESFNAIAYLNSPYRNPVIGWMDDLESMELEDLQAWYDKWYAPNNAILVVVGDVDPQEVHKLAKKYYGDFKPSEIKLTKPRREVGQSGQRRVVVKAPAELPYLLMGFPAPVINGTAEEWEPYALEVLAYILDGGDSTRFAKTLIRDQQIAAGTSVSYNPYSMHSNLFVLSGTPTANHTVDDLESALLGEIDKMKQELATEEELSRVKAQVVASNVYQKDSVYYQAMLLGMLETRGLSWRVGDEYVDRINAVTAEQVREVAKKYFDTDKMTVAVLDPQPMDTAQRRMPNMGGGHVH